MQKKEKSPQPSKAGAYKTDNGTRRLNSQNDTTSNTVQASTISEVAKMLDASGSGPKYMARCPAHEDSRASLSFQLSENDSKKIVYNCFTGCDFERDLLSALKSKGVVFPTKEDETKYYNYFNENGELVFQKVRRFPKDFRQRRPDGSGGWHWDLKGVKKILYNLPAVLAAREAGEDIYIVEGEKDADLLIKSGLIATTWSEGASKSKTKWLPRYTEQLRGASHVYILPDNDEPGLNEGRSISAALTKAAIPNSIVELPGLSDKQDVSDWIDKGHTVSDLVALCKRGVGTVGVISRHFEKWKKPQKLPERLIQSPILDVKMLPDSFLPMVTDISFRMQCPIDYIAATLLTVLGSVIGAGCGIKPKQRDDWFVVPNLWGGVVGDPSKLKTPAMMSVTSHLDKLQDAAKEQYDEEMKRFAVEQENYEIKQKVLKDMMRDSYKRSLEAA